MISNWIYFIWKNTKLKQAEQNIEQRKQQMPIPVLNYKTWLFAFLKKHNQPLKKINQKKKNKYSWENI